MKEKKKVSKLQQYIILGGVLVLFQTDGVRRIFQSASFLHTVLGAIGILLITAVVVSVSAEKRKKKRKEKEDDESSWL